MQEQAPSLASRVIARYAMIAFVLVALTALIAACSSDDDNGDETPAATSTESAGARPTSSTAEPNLSEQPIVYEATTNGITEVFLIDAGTGETTQVTSDGGRSGHPAWSPDYTRIIYTSNRGGLAKRNLFTVNRDGTDVQRLTNNPDAEHWAPKWSPDGSQVTYIEITEDEGSFLAVMDADGTNVRRLTPGYRFAEFPAWTRDGTMIYYAAIEAPRNNIDIFAVDPETLQITVIVQTDASDVCPHFSRDGTIMTYASVAPGETDNVDLFARKAPFDSHTDIGDDVRLTDHPAFDDYTNPSPDDLTHVFLSRRDGNAELYLMNPDGTNQRRLTNTPDTNENVPDW
jgi:TolB protein